MQKDVNVYINYTIELLRIGFGTFMLSYFPSSVDICIGVQTKNPYDKAPSCYKTQFKVNYLYFTVNVAQAKHGSTVHDVFYCTAPHEKSTPV